MNIADPTLAPTGTQAAGTALLDLASIPSIFLPLPVAFRRGFIKLADMPIVFADPFQRRNQP